MLVEEYNILIFHLREGRNKALSLAKEEALSSLIHFSPKLMQGGPLTDQNQVFCLQLLVNVTKYDQFQKRIMHLGYTSKVTIAVKTHRSNDKKRAKQNKGIIIWKGQAFKEHVLYEENKEMMRLKDPDQRTFLLQKKDAIEDVKGYRGHGEHAGRRALPVSDCRILINLALPCLITLEVILLDPFAGSGGILIEARELGATTYSIDNDESLVPGLSKISHMHFSASSAQMTHFKHNSIDAIATEVPFDEKYNTLIIQTLNEMHRVIKLTGKIAMMVAYHQAIVIEKAALDLSFKVLLKHAIDRKGTEVVIFVLMKSEHKYRAHAIANPTIS